jgi:hypothetical protein
MRRSASLGVALTLVFPTLALATPLALSLGPSLEASSAEPSLEASSLRHQALTLGLRLPGFLMEPVGAAPAKLDPWIGLGPSVHQLRLALTTSAPFPDESPKASAAERVPLAFRPLLEPARVLADLIVGEVSNVFQGITWELAASDDEHHLDFLRDFAGDISRGPYTRKDDVNSLPFSVDLRMVLCWRPTDRIKIEGGYAVAYLAGEPREGFGVRGPTDDRRSPVMIHGPCAGCSFSF